jgi:hypothetical protein
MRKLIILFFLIVPALVFSQNSTMSERKLNRCMKRSNKFLSKMNASVETIIKNTSKEIENLTPIIADVNQLSEDYENLQECTIIVINGEEIVGKYILAEKEKDKYDLAMSTLSTLLEQYTFLVTSMQLLEVKRQSDMRDKYSAAVLEYDFKDAKQHEKEINEIIDIMAEAQKTLKRMLPSIMASLEQAKLARDEYAKALTAMFD